MRSYILYQNDRSDLHRAAREQLIAEMNRRKEYRPLVQFLKRIFATILP